MTAGKWDQSLSQDQLTRVSAIVGLFKGLHLLFADDMADRWTRLRNKGPLFENRTPIDAMIEGGIPMMWTCVATSTRCAEAFSACPGKAGTGFPKRTCANSKK